MAVKKNNTEKDNIKDNIKDNKQDFEKALSRLEEIASLLEAGGEGKLSLEESLVLYEEGSGLAAFCLGRLKDAQQRITELSIAAEHNKTDDDSEE